MRFQDLLTAWLAIRQQKTRTALSLVGIVVGSILLLFGLAARRGVQDAVARVFSMNERMRIISTYPNWEFDEREIPPEELEVDGVLDEAMRSRIRAMLVHQWERGTEMVQLTQERIEKIEALRHVRRVHPQNGFMVAVIQDKNELLANGASVAADDKVLRKRILAGRGFGSDSDQTILLNEFVAWRWGYGSSAQMSKLVGTKIRIESRYATESLARSVTSLNGGDVDFTPDEIRDLNSALARLPEFVEQLPLTESERAALAKALPSASDEDEPATDANEEVTALELTVAGIFRGPTQEERDKYVRLGHGIGMEEFLLPIKTANSFALQLPHWKSSGFNYATVLVDDESHLRAVSKKISDFGLRADSLVEFVEFIQKQVRQITLIVSLIALFALVISAVGITNTMVMSVVERTQEIGVMKALGASERQIQLLFLMEGALIGVIGGAAALVIGLLIKIPVESLTISILESELYETFQEEHIISFPPWLQAVVFGFSTLVTTLATILPARRAARIDPVAALRHD